MKSEVIFLIVSAVIKNVASEISIYNSTTGDDVNITCFVEYTVPEDAIKIDVLLTWNTPQHPQISEQVSPELQLKPILGTSYNVGSSRTISSVDKIHEGIYKCSVLISINRSADEVLLTNVQIFDSTLLNVITDEIQFSVEETILTVEEGEDARWVGVVPNGTEPDNLLWTTYNNETTSPERYKIKVTLSMLQLSIEQTVMEDSQLFFVHLNDSIRISLQLIVLKKRNDQQIEAKWQESFVSECDVKPESPLEVTYERCANYVNPEDCISTRRERYVFPDLKYPAIVEVNRTAQTSGKVICNRNDTYSEQKVCVTDVMEGFIVEPIVKTQDEILIETDVVEEGDNVVLTCRRSYCSPTYKNRHLEWFFENDVRLQNLYSVGNSSVTAQIILSKITANESGTYVCKSTATEWKKLEITVVNSDTTNLVAVVVPIPSLLLLLACSGIYAYFVVWKRRQLVLEQNKKALDVFQRGDIDAIKTDKSLYEQADLLPFDPEWYFPRERLKLGKTLGSGFFGKVIEGEAERILAGEEQTKVAVKTVKNSADVEVIKAFEKEVKILANLGSHLFIVNMLGAVVDRLAQRELMLIVEYCHLGCLLNYLKDHRWRFVNLNASGETLVNDEERVHTYYNTGADGDLPLDTNVLMEWSYQISRGMEWLASGKIVHCDLAARNVLLANDNLVKICDFGLAHDLYKKEEYIKKKGALLPLKWMAIESVEDRVFSSQSDVWSFGVVVWELFTLGKTPYMEYENFQDTWNNLLKGYRLKKPDFAPQYVYELMISCWNIEPRKRPTFTELATKLIVQLEESRRNYYIKIEEEYEGPAQKKTGAVYMPHASPQVAFKGISYQINNSLARIINMMPAFLKGRHRKESEDIPSVSTFPPSASSHTNATPDTKQVVTHTAQADKVVDVFLEENDGGVVDSRLFVTEEAVEVHEPINVINMETIVEYPKNPTVERSPGYLKLNDSKIDLKRPAPEALRIFGFENKGYDPVSRVQSDGPPPLPTKSAKTIEMGGELIKQRLCGDHYEQPRQIVVSDQDTDAPNDTVRHKYDNNI